MTLVHYRYCSPCYKILMNVPRVMEAVINIATMQMDRITAHVTVDGVLILTDTLAMVHDFMTGTQRPDDTLHLTAFYRYQ